MRVTKNLGMILLGIWLIVSGLLVVISIPIPAIIGLILAVLAVAAGVLILLGR